MTALFLLALAAAVAARQWLGLRQERHVRAHRGEVPEPFRETVPPEAHARAADYTVARTRFARAASLYGAGVLLLFTLGGGLDALDRFWGGETLLSATGFVLSAFWLREAAHLPLALYSTFRLEQRFGFNRTTPGLFLRDLLREAALGLVLGGPLVAAALFLIGGTGAWWLRLWLLWVAVTVFFAWAYPVLIAPLFNRFRPLADDPLRERLTGLLEREGYRSGGVFVMDGSQRSTRANAYFTGLGARKRIVFFDTLYAMLTPPELEAVLAHELGHFRLRHVSTRLVLSAAAGLAGLLLLAFLLERPSFFEGLGVGRASAHAGLVLFLWVGPVIAFPVRPLLAWWSRRQEYAADAFAARHSEPGALARALVKLYEHNASTLTPDPVHSACLDSHPPAPLRIARLRHAG